MKIHNLLKVSAALVIIYLCTSFGFESESIHIRKINENNYFLVLFNKTHQPIFEAEYPVEPTTELLGSHLIQITQSLGNPNRYVFYFDTENMRISDVYYNPILIEDTNILYVDDERRLIYQDIFDASKMYREFIRNFSMTAVASNAVYQADIVNNTLCIKYFEGPDLVEREEEIPL
ncbi:MULTISPECIES: hypothetical protein [unclassified Paenibacillus]|uniref:hypothetical protein n=1 Tax=unclassified Paenibacillus TaxID=185978 RepID=UPI002405EEAC|nr:MULTISPECIES: hypothetical protein [unclassified Paenibacillus]MDF9840415.1 hypothetical protein [Paenibacillus sp. PastF-2]MDF9846997.1 hypothetical protein [Paenibacillus sp. PastM-2]MDF9853569.1 hypothetical protein [Paenibacillus sp. PastF-1]MDH6478945.1 hypothetical protein [Paenibacillus sp. PastH-2]MDH6506677.1 hypothetical protein [Paenibacillus sp. PastM-3]